MENILSTLINGLSLGGIYAMIALGYTMVYGIAKMLNFAHGDIIMVGGYVIYVFMALKNPLLAIAMAVVFCVILGIVIEKVAYKPLRGASPLAVLITAIGVSYLLQSLAQIVFGSANKMVTVYDFGSISFLGVSVQGSALVTLGVTVIVMTALTLFVKYTRLGRAMIAVSEDKGAAQLMGINVNGIITVTFAIGSALAALAGLFYLLKAPSVSSTLGAMPGIKAFTAAVIGGIGSIPGAMLGGILLGMVECISYKISAIAPYTDAIEFSILIVILLVRPTGFLGKKKEGKGIMNKLKKLNFSHYINYVIIGALTLALGSVSLSGGHMNSSLLFLLEKIAISIILSVSLSLVVGFLGELSLGHAGFMCVGAYLGGKAAVLLEPVVGNSPLNILICLIIGGGIAALCGLIIGIPALRLRGDYLAIVTLAFGEIVKSLFQNTSDKTFGGALGLETPRYNKQYLFIFAFILVLVTLAVVQNFIRSKHGRAVTAIRDNEIAARATGINVTKYKLLAFVISAFFAGIAGVLYSFSNYNVQSSKFGYNYSIEILVMVVLGGMGNINGSIIAAALITFLNTKLATILTGDLAVLQNLLYALVLIVIVIYNNAPGLKSFREKYNFGALVHKISKRGHDPSTIRDDKAKWDVVPTKIEMNEVLSIDLTPQDVKERKQNGGDK